MVPVTGIIQSISWELTPPPLHMPKGPFALFFLIHRVHRLWRWHNNTKRCMGPNGFLDLIERSAVSTLVGEIQFLRLSAYVILIAARILKCIDQHKRVYMCYQEWKQAFCFWYPISRKPSGLPLKSFDPTNETRHSPLKFKIRQIIHLTARLWKEIFTLSLNLVEAAEACSFDPYSQKESLHYLFENINTVLDCVKGNKTQLINRVQQCRPIIKRLFEKLGARDRTESIVQHISHAIRFSSYVSDISSKARKMTLEEGAASLLEKIHLPTLASFVGPTNQPRWSIETCRL